MTNATPQPLMIPFAPSNGPRAYSKHALAATGDLFSWLEPVSDEEAIDRLFAALDGKTNPKAWADWAVLTHAHALDIFHDGGVEAMAWIQASLEALHMLGNFLASSGPWSPGDNLVLEAGSFRLAMMPVSKEAASIEPQRDAGPADGPKEHRVLTMDDVIREIIARAPDEFEQAARMLRKHMPEASFPMFSMATGAWAALSVLGRSTGVSQLVLGGDDFGWIAKMAWSDAGQGGGPTGEIIDPADFHQADKQAS